LSLFPPAIPKYCSPWGLNDKVVGVTDYCNYPPEAAEKDSVGGFDKPNIEVILTLEPDLVLAGSLHEEVVTRLEERDIPSWSWSRKPWNRSMKRSAQ